MNHVRPCTLEPKYKGGGTGGLRPPASLPFDFGSGPLFVGFRLFAFFRLRNIAKCCVIFSFFSRFPPPWESPFLPPLLPPPVYTSSPLSPGLPSPCLPPHKRFTKDFTPVGIERPVTPAVSKSQTFRVSDHARQRGLFYVMRRLKSLTSQDAV